MKSVWFEVLILEDSNSTVRPSQQLLLDNTLGVIGWAIEGLIAHDGERSCFGIYFP